MDWKNITLYPELIVDILIYVGIAVVVCLISKWIYDAREERRNRREAEAYYQQRADAEAEDA